MAQRITQAYLVAKCETAARLTGKPLHISGAYGGWAVHMTVNEFGGVSDLTNGHIPARHVDLFLDGLIKGVRLMQE
jgi:hypothetical protein